MPGMMDTILNLGMSSKAYMDIDRNDDNFIFFSDCYRRFLRNYAQSVLGISKEDLNLNIAFSFKCKKTQMLEEINKYIDLINKSGRKHHLDDPFLQLEQAILAVIKSYSSHRATAYRNLNGLSDTGTAVTVQSMVFGNLDSNSATGVAFSRSPVSGENKLFGEYITGVQGEELVDGSRTPSSIRENPDSMEVRMPSLFNELSEICSNLELRYKDVQDIEFTIESGKLFILQTRAAKRNPEAAIKIAVDMVSEGLISKEEALMRIEPESINALLHSRIDYSQNPQEIGIGLPASPGAVTGIAVFSSHDAEIFSIHHKVILVRKDTSPEDIKGMHSASAILTSNGGMTSHAAVITRGMGKPCICGVQKMQVDEVAKMLKIGNHTIYHGEEITLDGSTGKVFAGKVPLTSPIFSADFETLLSWADYFKRLQIRANADTSLDVEAALKLGACGIGLCRTEHMFFEPDKIALIRRMIVAKDPDIKEQTLIELRKLQSADFIQIFRAAKGLPVNIRLLDPPLHEFLPEGESRKRDLARDLGLSMRELDARLEELQEVNPMLGHRGCRLGVSAPDIYKMQIYAIFDAVSVLLSEFLEIKLEIMIPFVSHLNELKVIKSYISEIAQEYPNLKNYSIGTMIELPRAALQAKELAAEVDYFDFGTNDLTQTTYGFSRDDISSFLAEYIKQGIIKKDPFIELDREGVGELIETAILRGKAGTPGLIFGVCGEHGGNPASIEFFERLGIDYVSCSPYRIPIARIAAAIACLKNQSLAAK
jgi:pyruvate,orthophosphate dikinase